VFNELSFVTGRDQWQDLACVVVIASERIVAGKSTSELRHTIASRRRGAKWYNQVARGLGYRLPGGDSPEFPGKLDAIALGFIPAVRPAGINPAARLSLFTHWTQ
jgi:hypothetical protein